PLRTAPIIVIFFLILGGGGNGDELFANGDYENAFTAYKDGVNSSDKIARIHSHFMLGMMLASGLGVEIADSGLAKEHFYSGINIIYTEADGDDNAIIDLVYNEVNPIFIGAADLFCNNTSIEELNCPVWPIRVSDNVEEEWNSKPDYYDNLVEVSTLDAPYYLAWKDVIHDVIETRMEESGLSPGNFSRALRNNSSYIQLATWPKFTYEIPSDYKYRGWSCPNNCENMGNGWGECEQCGAWKERDHELFHDDYDLFRPYMAKHDSILEIIGDRIDKDEISEYDDYDVLNNLLGSGILRYPLTEYYILDSLSDVSYSFVFEKEVRGLNWKDYNFLHPYMSAVAYATEEEAREWGFYADETRDSDYSSNQSTSNYKSSPSTSNDETPSSSSSATDVFSVLVNNMVYVPGGKIQVNGRMVSVSSFYICKYEITQELWNAVMTYNNSKWSGCSSCPVDRVTYSETTSFIEKIREMTGYSYRLPTEAEWMRAAAGAPESGYAPANFAGSSWGPNVAWYSRNSALTSHNIGGLEANELGLYDMSGNVTEWCSDWFGKWSPSSGEVDPTGPSSGSKRVLKGGSWADVGPKAKLDYRFRHTPWHESNQIGFRLAGNAN
ncbi:MAG: SUMF1/EgtB/PvdO family nonheme iron enzyme, partial [Bacteroidetes bacterium]|nr:SUMF1/EgtB/PvdO family nonheme iron enzyme [Bacteroidota bacterium]